PCTTLCRSIPRWIHTQGDLPRLLRADGAQAGGERASGPGRRAIHALLGIHPDTGPGSGRSDRCTSVSVSLETVRACLDGVIPGAVATCSADGTPNISYISQVEYVDGEHIALSFQFFNKTRRNVLEQPLATVAVTHPITGASYMLMLRYLRTEAEGSVFERMKAKLAGIASHEGMTGVFRLRGADI